MRNVTDHTKNFHLRSDCFTIRGLTVFVDVEFLSSKPPVSDAIGRTDVLGNLEGGMVHLVRSVLVSRPLGRALQQLWSTPWECGGISVSKSETLPFICIRISSEDCYISLIGTDLCIDGQNTSLCISDAILVEIWPASQRFLDYNLVVSRSRILMKRIISFVPRHALAHLALLVKGDDGVISGRDVVIVVFRVDCSSVIASGEKRIVFSTKETACRGLSVVNAGEVGIYSDVL
ncbi:hypothetical protein Tco_1563634 [Tanacetum coccineum]